MIRDMGRASLCGLTDGCTRESGKMTRDTERRSTRMPVRRLSEISGAEIADGVE